LFCYRGYIDQHRVAIVCSARSGSTKALGTTNLLLRAASEALRCSHKKTNSGSTTPFTNGLFRGVSYSEAPSAPDSPRARSSSSTRSASPTPLSSLTPLTVPQAGQTSPKFNATVDLIRTEHLLAARTSVRDPYILEELEAEIEKDCDWLRGFLFAAQVCAGAKMSQTCF
jgi:aspartate kinase